MLSYMIPSVDDKSRPDPPDLLQLTLGSDKDVIISKDISINSFVSDNTATASNSSMTPTSISEKSKHKHLINGGKHQSLKRVSFGSSKGSMVETLIFESPVQEEPEPSPIIENVNHFSGDEDQTEAEREKVRVTFFQQTKPKEVDLPDEPIVFSDNDDFMMISSVSMNETNHIHYNRTESVESGWENPFRPGGDLSREADEIVQLIKGGKPITPTSGNIRIESSIHNNQNDHHNNYPEPIVQSPKKTIQELESTPKSVNGNVLNDTKTETSPSGAVDIKRGTVKPDGDASQVEHIIIKKKPKCKCCVIQ